MGINLKYAIPKAVITVIDSELGAALLAANTKNRRIRAILLDEYEREMRDGRFLLTNQGIGVSRSGVLLDGQHRLLALQRLGWPANVQSLVVFGLEEEAQACVDQHAKRSMADVVNLLLGKEGDARCSTQFIGAIRFYGYAVLSEKKDIDRKPSSQMIVEWISIIGDVVAKVLGVPQAGRLAVPVIAAIAYQIQHGAPWERAAIFMDQLISGAGLEADSPVLRLRNFLASKKAGGVVMQVERWEKTNAAFMAFMEGRTLARLQRRAA